jgi:hypothetical protein
MSDLRLPLTDKNVFALPAATAGRYIARDDDLAGFFVRVGARRKTFMIQADLRAGGLRQTILMKVGEAGEISTREARGKAKQLLGAIAAGEDPRPKKVEVGKSKPGDIPTLREAWTRYRVSHLERKNRSKATIHHYGDHIERLMADWLDESLGDLGENPRLVADRHERLTTENGPMIANSAMRSLRAVYNHARKTCRKLPAENPTFAVDWNPQYRRDTAMGLKDLPAWFEQLASIPNPVRREFHLLTLLSGSRPQALKIAKPEHLNLAARTLRIAKPKGGEERAFDIPLSRPMVAAFIRLLRFGRIVYPEQSRDWLFPADSASGHLSAHSEDRKLDLSHWGNDLRQTYRTMGQVAGISELDIHLLMNHALQGVNSGYITRSKLISDHLRGQQEKLSGVITGAVVGPGRRPSPLLSRWLHAVSRAQMEEMLEQDPDAVRAQFGSRSGLRKLEIQAARVAAQGLDDRLLDAPSRRHARARAA